MGLFDRSRRREPEFGTGPIVSQSNLAGPAPDIAAVVEAAITGADRPQADPVAVLAAIERVLAAQMDVYANALPAVDHRAVRRMREVLAGRPDFRLDMYFTGLTYFGPSGVAMANGLAEQLTVFVPELTQLVRAGRFDRSGPGGGRDERA